MLQPHRRAEAALTQALFDAGEQVFATTPHRQVRVAR